MKLLAVETATRCQSVALMDEAVLLAEKNQENCASHAGSLVPAIQDLLTSLSCPFSAIEGLAVSAGPGSFTGLRVGLSTMVGFRTVTGLPLVTVPTLEAMAWSHRASGHPVCPVLVARTDEIYWAQFQWENGHAVRLLEDRVGTIQDMLDSIRQPTVLFGEGWLRHRRVIMETLGDMAIGGEPESMNPSAYHVGLASLDAFHTGKFAGSHISPHYVQRPDAEVQWDLKTRRASPR
ncbi:MAG: tRNA (adenosine(37)-N6)-threonylcarbamoyltransferase complex dimerization subunit type 1 TsaB [Nitrospira sp.]|nr:tRNA (adenosine(37)-N6)-threonylcarbamoyltransferase complex dimerization subunit type 1 TsaB [Nitrospira sp.]